MYRKYKSKTLGQGCLFDLNFFEFPVVNLRPNEKLLKAGLYADARWSRERYLNKRKPTPKRPMKRLFTACDQNKRLRKFCDLSWAQTLNFFSSNLTRGPVYIFFVILLNLFLLLYMLLISVTFSTIYVICFGHKLR